MFNKKKYYEFSKIGFQESKKSFLKRTLDKPIVKTVCGAVTIVFIKSTNAYADKLDDVGWKMIGIARKGLFWMCMLTSFYGLYMMVLKRDDKGKKIIVTAILVYVGSWLIPEGFMLIEDMFSPEQQAQPTP